MNIVDLPLAQIKESPWNPNMVPEDMAEKLRTSLRCYGLVQNLVVRPVDDVYEVIAGNQRLKSLADAECETVPCVVVDLDDAQARLLAQAMNRVHGEDDLGMRAELISQVLEQLPREEVLSVLPETSESLKALSSLGQMEMSEYLQNWQRAQVARLKHLQFQLTSAQLEVIEEALHRMVPMTRENMGDSPNARGTALFLLCKEFLERNVTP